MKYYPDPPEDYRKVRNKKVAGTVLLMKLLNGIPYEEGFSLFFQSSFGWQLREEETKAWYRSDYWTYYYIVKEHGLEPKPGLEWYDRSDISMLMEEADRIMSDKGWNSWLWG